MNRTRSTAALVALLILAGCATVPTQATRVQRLYASYGTSLEVAVDVYSGTLRAAGEAYRAGLIDDAQLAKVRTAGVAAQGALEAARSALLLAMTWPERDYSVEFALALAQANEALLKLIEAAKVLK